MSNLEPGCKAIVVKGAANNDPNIPTNIGKVVTVGRFLGKVYGWVGHDRWETDILMTGTTGGNSYHNREFHMQRIDDHNTDEFFERKKELTTLI